MRKQSTRWMLLIVLNVAAWCMLGFYQNSVAAPKKGPQLPFGNPVEQRGEMVQQLKEIKSLLKEQNQLLRSGRVKVTVSK